MENKYGELLDFLIEEQIQEFKKVSSGRKSQIIFNNFSDYFMYQEKHSRAKTKDKKDSFAVSMDRCWILANKQLKTLNNDEMKHYLLFVKNKLQSSINSKNKDLLKNKLMFMSLLRQLPPINDEENMEIVNNIKSCIENIDKDYEK